MSKMHVLLLERRICMDMCMADVTGLDVHPGDEAEIFGRHLPAEEAAALAGTIQYELLCAVSPRVPREYLEQDGDKTL